MQSRQPIHKNFATEVIKLTGRNRDIYRDATVYCGLRLRGRLDLHFIVTTRFEIGLKTTRDVGNPRVSERLF